LRIAADHEGFADLHSSTGANGKQGFGFRDGKTDGLFAENMLAGFGRFNGPGYMEMIGKRIVDGVDIRVGEKFFVRAISLGNAKSVCRLLGLRHTSRCDGDDTCVLASLHGGMTFLPILAVLRTPQRSLLDMLLYPPFVSWNRFRKTSINSQAGNQASGPATAAP